MTQFIKNDTKKSFSAKTKKWVKLMFPGYSLQAFSQRHRQKICPLDPIIQAIPANANILDVGCGAGLVLGLLALSGSIQKGVGFDSNPDAINTAKKMIGRLKIEGIKFKTIQVEQPWPDGKFDTIIMIDVMHHIPVKERKKCLEKIAEKLPSNGLFIYKDMKSKPFIFGLGNRIHDLLFSKQWVTYMPKKEVISIFKENGIGAIQQQEWSRFWYGHELIVFKKP